MAFSKRKRFEIFKRDAFTCQYCGNTPPTVVLEVDHILAVANGGDDDPLNLTTSCFDCNRGKSDVALNQVTKNRKVNLEYEKEGFEQLKLYNKFLKDRREFIDEIIERLGTYWHDAYLGQEGFVFGTSRAASIRTFLKYLNEEEILSYIDIAFSKFATIGNKDTQAWKYFCGICWRRIRQRQNGGVE